MTAAAPTFSQIKAQVAAIRQKIPQARVFGIRAAGRWTGDAVRQDGDLTYCIHQCDSPLAMRLALREAANVGILQVLITGLDEHELSNDILVRLTRRKLYQIDDWQIVRSLFQAQTVDPRLARHSWIADALLDHIPAEGYPPARGGFLDAETVWPLLLRRSMGLTTESPDLTALLKWSIDADGAARFRQGSEEFREAAIQWLSERAGPAAGVVLHCVAQLERADALPLGLAAGVVFHPSVAGKVEKAAVRLEERYLGGQTPDASVIGRWAAAATEVVRLQLTDIKIKRQKLQRADEILCEIQADEFAYLSDTSPLGFDQRLAKFGGSLVDFVSSRSGSVEKLQEGRKTVREHDLANRETRRLERVEMALRLARWLAQQQGTANTPPNSLSAAAQRHLCEGGIVDWARFSLRAGDPVQELSAAYSRLFEVVTTIRELQAEHFARLLADWTVAGSPGDDVVSVERILERIVAPLAAERPVLVIVIDGMSAAVGRELLADLTRHEWMVLSEAGRTFNRPGIATIPSVTEFSRTSLLCGRLRQGNSTDERAGFAEHPALLAQCRSGYPPVLFHKAALQESNDVVLAADVRKEIASDRRKVVGVVINAVDDHLLKGEQLDTRWSRDEIKVLPPLLHEARMARRLVILVSDHGHVLDCQAQGRQYEDGGERWRAATGEPAGDELIVQGQRVLTDGHRLMAPWSERVRYGMKKNGYHGGLTPQEMVVPIVVLSSTDDFPKGWQEQPVDTPAWWDEVVPAAVPADHSAPKLKPATRQPSEPLFDHLEDGELVPAPAAVGAPGPEWVARLLASAVFVEQKRLGGRGLPSDKVFTKLLGALDQRGGKLTSTALARALEFPALRLPGLLAKVQRVLNIDGYAVVSRDDASDTIELNRGLLLKQFDLV